MALELVHDRAHVRVEPGGLSDFVIQDEDVYATVAPVAAGGVQPEESESPHGSADFWTACGTDPDCYRIEFVQWPGGHLVGMARYLLADPEQSL